MSFVQLFKEWLNEVCSQHQIEIIYLGDTCIQLNNLKILLYPLNHLKVDKYQFHDTEITIHIDEDIWMTKRIIVQSRILSQLGLLPRIHGRKTKIIRINQEQASQFLNQNHLNEYTSAYYKYALTYHETIVAVALFSKKRKMNDSGNNSYELIRFSNLLSHTVVGGLSKLIQFFINEHQVDELMTYIDLDWGNGLSFIKMGFIKVSEKPPQNFWISKDTYQRYYPSRFIQLHQLTHLSDDEIILSNNLTNIQNRGNLKLIKYIH